MKVLYLVTLATLCLAADAYGDLVTIVDTTPGTATNNGTITTGEYVGFSSGINSGFGNVIGKDSQLHVDSSLAGALNFGLKSGGGSLNDAAVIYIDSISGGFTGTGGFTDKGDPGRAALSGLGTQTSDRSTLNFASGFTADYGIAIEKNFAGLFQLQSGGAHTFVTSVNLTPTGNAAAGQWELNLSLTNIGLSPGIGASFKYVATYLNFENAFRSNEFHGVASFGDNPGHNTVNLAAGDFNTFISAVPEASSFAAGALVCCLVGVAYAVRALRQKRAAAI